jgi:hypothetical protein
LFVALRVPSEFPLSLSGKAVYLTRDDNGALTFVFFSGINVPRRRFLPVKRTSDLLLAMSNLYLMHHGELTMNPRRSFPTVPLIELGSFYKKVRTYIGYILGASPVFGTANAAQALFAVFMYVYVIFLKKNF